MRQSIRVCLGVSVQLTSCSSKTCSIAAANGRLRHDLPMLPSEADQLGEVVRPASDCHHSMPLALGIAAAASETSWSASSACWCAHVRKCSNSICHFLVSLKHTLICPCLSTWRQGSACGADAHVEPATSAPAPQQDPAPAPGSSGSQTVRARRQRPLSARTWQEVPQQTRHQQVWC